MKILEIIHNLSSGGAERLVVDLCNEMSKTENVVLVLLKDLAHNNGDFYLPEVSERVRVIKLNFQDGFSIHYLWKVYRTIVAENPDVVHVHCMLNYCLLALSLDWLRRKYIQTLHIDIEHIRKKRDYNFAFNTFGRIKRLKLVAISKTNYKEFCMQYPFCSASYINNGRAIQQVTEQYEQVCAEIEGYRRTPNTVVALNVARCSKQKNHKLLISSVNALRKEGYDIVALIVGSGYFDTPLGDELQSLAGDSIYFLGPKTNVVDYMKACDVFCLSSDFEGMPITAIEAILNGKPILSTRVCGMVDVVDDGENGLLSKDNSELEYKKMFYRYLSVREKLEKNARTQENNNSYTIEACSKSYLNLFQS